MLQDDIVATQKAGAEIKESLTKLLGALPQPVENNALIRSLQPRADDWAKVWVPNFADSMRAGYESLWQNPPPMGVAGDKSQLDAYFAMSQMFSYPNPFTERFPGGYRRIGPALQPDRLWIAWRYHRFDEAAGHFFDGLVWIDDHYAWFPKPWRILERGPVN